MFSRRGKAPGAAAAPIVRVAIVDDKAIHGLEKNSGELGHLFRSRGQFSRTRSGLLNQFAHPLHRANYSLRARSLLFDGGIDLLRDFREAIGGLRDLRRAARLLHGGCADFLRELVNFRNHVGNLLERVAQILIQQ